ncbi:hypothetical protein OSCI_3860066 [Kamptonema sp. PCC 6506]|nr:hypothetical protein OSCI_3860066 [Kamptonema sp. PCC 6506]
MAVWPGGEYYVTRPLHPGFHDPSFFGCGELIPQFVDGGYGVSAHPTI